MKRRKESLHRSEIPSHMSVLADLTSKILARRQLYPELKMWTFQEDGKTEIRMHLVSIGVRDHSLIRFWNRVPYAALAKVFSLIEATTKRIEKTSLLTSFLLLVIRRRAKGDTQSLLQAVYLCINRVRLFTKN